MFVPVALAPPRLFRANPHAFQYETLGLHNVKEQLTDQVRGPGADHFQTRPKPANNQFFFFYTHFSINRNVRYRICFIHDEMILKTRVSAIGYGPVVHAQ